MLIRTQYADILTARRTRAPLSFLLSCAGHFAATPLSYLLRRPLAGPVLGTVSITHRCNLACPMCNFPQRAAADLTGGLRELSTERWKRIIDGYAALGTKGLGFTGGEPLLRPDLTELLAYAVAKGMVVNLNTNALLMTDERAREICASGIDSVNVSFDRQHLADARARETFLRNVTALCATAHAASPRVRVKLVLTTDLTDESGIPDLAETVLAVGADRAEVLLEQPFARAGAPDPSARMHAYGRLEREIAAARVRGVTVDNSARMLRVMKTFARTSRLPIPCYSGYTTLGIDPYGRPFSCMSRVSRGEYVMQSPVDDLPAFWRSAHAQRHRNATRSCRRCCLNCQQELNLLFSPWWL